jgi:ABC-type glycerol-3-phosphate transport system substrate-binding protein
MGRSKKFLLVVLSVLLLLVAAGCGLGKDPAPSQGQAVTVTGMPEQKVLPELVAAYNQAGRKYRLQYQPDASQPVDCYLETQAAVQQLARQQKLAPLTVKDNPVPAAFRDGAAFLVRRLLRSGSFSGEPSVCPGAGSGTAAGLV